MKKCAVFALISAALATGAYLGFKCANHCDRKENRKKEIFDNIRENLVSYEETWFEDGVKHQCIVQKNNADFVLIKKYGSSVTRKYLSDDEVSELGQHISDHVWPTGLIYKGQCKSELKSGGKMMLANGIEMEISPYCFYYGFVESV